MYFIILPHFIVNFITIGSRIFWKKFGYFSKIIFFSIEMKRKWKSTLYFDFCFISELIWSRKSHWNKTSRHTFHKITIILARGGIQFWDLHFLYILKVLAFLDYVNYILKGLNLLDKAKIYVQKLYNTANQNNSVVDCYSYLN